MSVFVLAAKEHKAWPACSQSGFVADGSSLSCNAILSGSFLKECTRSGSSKPWRKSASVAVSVDAETPGRALDDKTTKVTRETCKSQETQTRSTPRATEG
jgi:hypothetical protein